jgi:hypothetical protein
VGALEAVPDEVGLGGGHPAAGHEEVEDEVHGEEEDDDVEDLGGARGTMVRERESLRLTM